MAGWKVKPKRSSGDKRKKGSKKRIAIQRTGNTVSFSIELFEADPIPYIEQFKIEELPSIIEQIRGERYIPNQVDILEVCLRRILALSAPSSNRSPREEQVQVLRRLIFGMSDTLLIARTGFGKSLIFQAYSILTNKITLQFIPLNKLGEEQFEEIQRLGCTRPCLLISETKQRDPKLLDRIAAGEFSHILLSPEQAASKAFRAAVKNPVLQARIGLVGIDECHLVKQWQNFRAHFTMIGELRTVLSRDVVWFGCTATLDSEAEKLVLRNAGFRSVGPNIGQTEVIRTSIDRPDIFLAPLPIPRGKLGGYTSLYFLLDQATTEINATPQDIPKTIIFVDGRTRVDQAAIYLRNLLVAKTSAFSNTPRFVHQGDGIAVNSVIQTFTAHVAQYDKDQRYTEFSKESSSIRIMVATTSLGIGVNIPDIARVVIWKFPIDKDPSEVWQRIGRGGRGPGQKSIAYIFLPYWVFDSEGIEPAEKLLPSSTPASTNPKKAPEPKRRKQSRHTLPEHRAFVPASSRLREVTVLDESTDTTPGDLSDTESIYSCTSNISTSIQAPTAPSTVLPNIPRWNQTERTRRKDLPRCWVDIANNRCKRTAFLLHLGEGNIPEDLRSTYIRAEHCCNGCSPMFLPSITSPPEPAPVLKAPRAGTKSAIALSLIDKWAIECANKTFNHPNRRFPMPASAYIPSSCRWELAYLISNSSNIVAESLTWETLCTKCSSLSKCLISENQYESLINQLQRIAKEVDEIIINKQLQKAANKATEDARKAANIAQTATRTPICPTAETTSAETERIKQYYSQYARQQGDNIARQASVLDRERSRLLSSTFAPSSQIGTPSTSQVSWVETILKSATNETLAPRPANIDPDIAREVDRLQSIRERISTPPRRPDFLQNAPLITEEVDNILQTPQTPQSALSSISSKASRKTRRASISTPTQAGKRRRVPLGDIHTNTIPKPIPFLTRTPTRSGRNAKSSLKGEEIYFNPHK